VCAAIREDVGAQEYDTSSVSSTRYAGNSNTSRKSSATHSSSNARIEE
jgi:hypothetical protein